MTLLGVRSRHNSNLQLNPDLQHILEADDICYYIGFAREEYSKVGGVSTVHTALWNACASIGLLSIGLAGIDLDTVANSGSANGENEVDFAAKSPHHPEKVKFFIPEPDSSSTVGISPSATFPDPGHQHHGDDRARKGLQLLRFHSRMDVHVNPIVKVTRPIRKLKSFDICPVPEYEAEPTCPTSPDAQHMTFDLAQIEEGRQERKSGDAGRGQRGVDRLLQRSVSYTGAEKQKTWSPSLKRLALYSSDLSLVSTPATSLPELPQSPGSSGWSLACLGCVCGGGRGQVPH